jgi:hypothetical protein
MKLLITQFSPTSHHFISLQSKHSPERLVLNYCVYLTVLLACCRTRGECADQQVRMSYRLYSRKRHWMHRLRPQHLLSERERSHAHVWRHGR